MTRSEQVLERLRQANGNWVDGSELATEQIGGSEGLKRLRELRAAGHPIEERRHPNPRRDIWQYRLVRRSVGQMAAFDQLEQTPPKVPTQHAGTTLDATWTHEVGGSFYDESQRMFQTTRGILKVGEDRLLYVNVPSADYAMVAAKVDWVEFIEHDGGCWRIPTKRLMAEGVGREIASVRYIGCPMHHWQHIERID